MKSPPLNPEFSINAENFHPCKWYETLDPDQTETRQNAGPNLDPDWSLMEEIFENLKTNLNITNNHEKLVTFDAKHQVWKTVFCTQNGQTLSGLNE